MRQWKLIERVAARGFFELSLTEEEGRVSGNQHALAIPKRPSTAQTASRVGRMIMGGVASVGLLAGAGILLLPTGAGAPITILGASVGIVGFFWTIYRIEDVRGRQEILAVEAAQHKQDLVRRSVERLAGYSEDLRAMATGTDQLSTAAKRLRTKDAQREVAYLMGMIPKSMESSVKFLQLYGVLEEIERDFRQGRKTAVTVNRDRLASLADRADTAIAILNTELGGAND